ncbi:MULTISPECIES: hypothetical protein [Yersinia pseudotuberculosis complex]|uniref:Uncharacterized protein n=1 Tax=Yersinia similis TaxID=367190 RepID=A0A0T9PSZ8_9GAMM|nr:MULTISPECIES: hypothetical protein [Yersinia pseudotuberculosis complex]BET62847.1 hypothetical protein YPSE1_23060 [Yersinia pseudotuberculosis]CND24024.1 Uncharacterised protein [Yersinia pseudotuberculosis]CNG46647.1 Uncharacterised protein [Yersinia similis]CNH80769.1 Uncharacterised protein [Yersinia similis]
MTVNDDFREFVNSFALSSIDFSDGFVSVCLNEQSVKAEDFSKQLKTYGLIAEIIIDDNTLAFSIGSGSFRDDSIIFSSLDSLWRKSCSLSMVPEKFLLLSEQRSSFDDFPEINSIKQFIEWRTVLVRLSNHHFDTKSIWYLPDDEGGKEIVVEMHDNLSRVKKVNFSSLSLDSASKLIMTLNLDDAQSGERKSILKKAISDFVKDDKSIDNIITAGERVYNRYNDLLDLYTKRFSVNSILSEIEKKNIEYTTKINDFISSSQSKAFAIPGALIAVAALAKVTNEWEYLLVLIGLWMIYYITKTSNDVLRESYDHLVSDLDESFSRYYEFDEGKEVRKSAAKTLESLKIKIQNAKSRLNNIDLLGIFMFFLGVLYIIFK